MSACIALMLLLPPASQAAAVTKTFSSATNAGTTGTFVVPAGVTSIRVEAIGGKGGNTPAFGAHPARTGGYGALVSGNLPVVPGQTLYVYVAGNGENATENVTAAGGANGGGASGGSPSFIAGAGGGGASDVRTIAAPTSGSQTTSLESRLLVAAGGGGSAAADNAGTIGNGNGGSAGQPGPSSYAGAAAQPGTANANGTGAGGAGGGGGCCTGQSGVLGEGGAAGSDGLYEGGGGGGGLYGGGGGSSYYGQPGAGGASWAEQSASNASVSQIDTTGEPRVTISYEPSAPSAATTAAPVVLAAAPAPAPVAPVVSSLSALHRCVTSAAIDAPHASGHGLAFSFTLSEAANTTFTVLHRVGSPKWAKCPRPSGHTLSTYKSVGAFSAPMSAGQQTTSIGTTARARHVDTSAQFGRGRHRISLARIAAQHLRPGTYVLAVKAVNSAGQVSGVSYVKFWVFS